MPHRASWTLEPLGDQAVLATCRDETTAQSLAASVRARAWPGVQDIVVAYHFLAVYIDPALLSVKRALDELKLLKPSHEEVESRLHTIPCCYEMGEDLASTAERLGLSTEEVIKLHTQTVFTIYAIGFSPGFPYLGWLPKELQGVSRRNEPRVRVPVGSVAIVGKQSAIYPQATPGGWALIGRTPLEIVNVQQGFFPMRIGDRVQFQRIDHEGFDHLLGGQLSGKSVG